MYNTKIFRNKFIVKMTRTSIICMTFFTFALNCLAINSYSQTVRLSVNLDYPNLKDAIVEIQNQTDFDFLYSKDIEALYLPNTQIRVENGTIEAVLNQLFMRSRIEYLIVEKTIVLTPAKVASESSEYRQGFTVTGTVADAEGETIPGVNVTIKGTTQGITTDSNGRYSIMVPDENATLVFSYIGFATQEFVVGSQRVINVSLFDDASQIEEIVVIGYGTARRRDLTGATGRVNASEIQNRPSNNVMDHLRGTVAGFNSNMATSARGGGSMEIRGRTSLSASNNPLIVLDGMIYNGDISDINPADIESIDILKDGSAAAVYGTRASAGVVAITTKRGMSEKPVIDFNASWGMSQLTKRQERFNGEEYVIMRGDVMRSRGNYSRPEYYYRNPNNLPAGVTLDMWLDGQTGDPATLWLQNRLLFSATEIRNYNNNKTIDWYDEVFQTGLRHDYNIGVGGKSKMTSYYFSLGYLNNDGIIVGDKYQNIRSRLNLSMDITDWLQIGTNIQFSDRDQSTNPADWGSAVRASPYSDKYEADGVTLKWMVDDVYVNNPLRDQAADFMDKHTNLVANLYTQIQLPFGIKYQMIFNNLYAFSKNYRFYSIETWEGRPIATPDGDLLGGRASREDGSLYSWQVDNIFSWNKTFADIHRIDATFLINAEKTQTWGGSASASQFAPTDALGYHNLAVGLSSSRSIANNDTYYTGNALMGRINYALMDKYLLTASYRRDGFSAFGQSNPHAYFPAIAVAWRLSEESFMNGVNWLDHAKIRLSWGVNGNRSIGIYSALSEVGSGKTIIGGNAVTRIFSNTLANSDLRWERTTANNAGLDFSIFNNLLSGSIEGYMMSTTDLLMTRTLPPVIAYASVLANLGEVTNKGMEITLNSTNLKRENFMWGSTFLFSFNRNEVKHLYGTMQNVLDDNGNIIGQREADDDFRGWYIGEALDRIYGYEYTGIWQESEREEALKYGRVPGDGKLRDVRNFEGRTEGIRSEEDRIFQGYTLPRYRLGLRNDFKVYKNFNLSFFFRADLGHYVANNHLMHNASLFQERHNSYKFEYWTPENPISTATRLQSGASPAYSILVKRSFVRLQDVSLSYSLPGKICSAIHLQSARVYVNMNNMLTVTDSRVLWDPETGIPTPRIVSFGINITL